MKILKGVTYIFASLVLLSFAITAWDLFVADPCHSYNRGHVEGCE